MRALSRKDTDTSDQARGWFFAAEFKSAALGIRWKYMVSSITSINEMLNKAFALAYFIHGDRRIALRIATDAMAKLEVATTAQYKRLYYRPTGRSSHQQGDAKRSKISFSDLHLLQRLVYIESEQHEKQKEQAGNSVSINEEDMIIHFIKHLVKITLRRNSFYVALGLSRLLHNYSTPEAMDIYSVVSQDPERVKDDYYYRSRKRLLIGEMKERFGNLIDVRRGTRGEERFQACDAPQRYLGLVKECLLFFTPWQTPCLVPQGFDPTLEAITAFSSELGIEEDKVEINRIHAILEPDCFQRLIEGIGFDAPSARLEVPCFSISQDSDRNDGPRTGRHEPRRLNEQELLAVKGELSELTARRKSTSAGLLRVLVDGIERACLDLNYIDQTGFDIESSAELLEVRGQDAAGEILLASHLFVHDTRGDGLAAYKLPILLETGQKLLIAVRPSKQGTGEWGGASVFISCRESSSLRVVARLARQLGARASERLHSETSSRPRNLIPILASVLLAICAAGAALYMRIAWSVNDQPVVSSSSSSQQEDMVMTLDDPPTPKNQSPMKTTKSEDRRLRATASGREQTTKIVRRPASRQRRGLPLQENDKYTNDKNRIAPLVASGTTVHQTNGSEIELTRDIHTELPASSLAEVKRIYIEVRSTEDEALGARLYTCLTQALGFSQKLILAAQKDDADGLLKISVARIHSTDHQEDVEAPRSARANGDTNEDREVKPTVISVMAQLLNAQGKVIWPAEPRNSQKKYQGTDTEVSTKIIKDLLEDIDDQKRRDH